MSEQIDPTNKQVHLFTLRIWAVENGETVPQRRIRLQNIQSGDVYFCSDLQSLLAHLEIALREQVDVTLPS